MDDGPSVAVIWFFVTDSMVDEALDLICARQAALGMAWIAVPVPAEARAVMDERQLGHRHP